MRRTGRIVITLITVLLLVLISACAPTPKEITPTPTPSPEEVTPTPPPEEITPPPTPEPTPTMEWGIIEIWVTDPPPPGVETADVTLTKIEVHKAEEDVWITIIDYGVTFDLFKIIEEADIIGTLEMEAPARFTQIRMDVTTVEGLTKEDPPAEYEATVPSEKLKLVKSFEVKAGWITKLTLDFDGDKSLIMTGEGKFLFRPVVKLLIEYEELP